MTLLILQIICVYVIFLYCQMMYYCIFGWPKKYKNRWDIMTETIHEDDWKK